MSTSITQLAAAFPDNERPHKNTSRVMVTLLGAAWDLGAPSFGSSTAADIFFKHSRCQGYPWKKVGKQQGFLRTAQTLKNTAVVPQIAPLCLQLARRVSDALNQQRKFVVIGGDHSCAIGTWNGVAHALGQKGSFGLIWIDAHLDSHTPDTSASMRLHGMPLAVLLGYGDQRLTRLLSTKPVIHPGTVCVVGARSYEAPELELLQRLGVRIFFISEIQKRGLNKVMAEAVDIASSGSGKFGISIDLDVLNPEQAPGVNTPVVYGLNAKRLVQTLRPLSENPGLLGVEIAEFNPVLDRKNRTLKIIEALLFSLFPRLEEVTDAQPH